MKIENMERARILLDVKNSLDALKEQLKHDNCYEILGVKLAVRGGYIYDITNKIKSVLETFVNQELVNITKEIEKL